MIKYNILALLILISSCSKYEKKIWGEWRSGCHLNSNYSYSLSFFPNGKYSAVSMPVKLPEINNESNKLANAVFKDVGNWSYNNSSSELIIKINDSFIEENGKTDSFKLIENGDHQEDTYKVEFKDDPEVIHLTEIKTRFYRKNTDTFEIKKNSEHFKMENCKLNRVTVFENK